MSITGLGMVNLAVFTSCREVGRRESIGRRVIDPQNGVDHGYREGVIERIAKILANPNHPLANRFNLKAIIMDDDDQQYKQAWNEAQLWPGDAVIPLRNDRGMMVAETPLEQLMVRIARGLKGNRKKGPNESGQSFSARLALAKQFHEVRILQVLLERKVDLVLCDSYITIFGNTLLRAYPERIINIHPGIIASDDPDRLPGLTPTRDAYTRAVSGFIIIDDKRIVGIPVGPEFEVEYQGRMRRAVQVKRGTTTGVTFHTVTTEIDNGPIIRCQTYRYNPATITEETIRTKNYQIKHALFPQVLLDYSNRPGIVRRILASRNRQVELAENC